MTPLRVGIVGCGNISDIYLTNLQKFEGTTVAAVADLDETRAKEKASKYEVPQVLTTDELLTGDAVDLVLNLTIPNAHYGVALRALEAGKHVYNEKPLSISREEGKRLVDLAKEKGVRLGCAPDTVLGAGIQTCRRLIDAGAIGEPIGVNAVMLSHGVEAWHPNPEFYYKRGGGPMFDMGPYYLSALVTLMGGVKSVTGMTRVTFPQRHVTSQPFAGLVIDVDVPTHVVGLLQFESGAIGELTTSFDVWWHQIAPITLYGTEGSMLVGDPNSFGDKVYWRRHNDADWRWEPQTHAYGGNSRGVGVLDMAKAIQENRPHRASGDLAFHVLDAMHAIHEAAEQRRQLDLVSRADRPDAMPEAGLEA